MDERRRHVRARPTPSLPAHVVAEVSREISETLDVIDISVGGLCLMQGMKKEPVGSPMKMRLVLPDGTHPIEGTVRWVAKGTVGVEFAEHTPDTAKAIRTFIGELLERGDGL